MALTAQRLVVTIVMDLTICAIQSMGHVTVDVRWGTSLHYVKRVRRNKESEYQYCFKKYFPGFISVLLINKAQATCSLYIL